MNIIKVWGKRIAFATGALILFGMLLDAWVRFELPRPAMIADIKRLDKGQAGLGTELYRDRINDLQKEKRQYRWRLQDVKKSDPGNIQQHRDIEKWIDQIDQKIKAAEKKRRAFEDRKLFLEKGK